MSDSVSPLKSLATPHATRPVGFGNLELLTLFFNAALDIFPGLGTSPHSIRIVRYFMLCASREESHISVSELQKGYWRS
jgi:hypothetical protein